MGDRERGRGASAWKTRDRRSSAGTPFEGQPTFLWRWRANRPSGTPRLTSMRSLQQLSRNCTNNRSKILQQVYLILKLQAVLFNSNCSSNFPNKKYRNEGKGTRREELILV